MYEKSTDRTKNVIDIPSFSASELIFHPLLAQSSLCDSQPARLKKRTKRKSIVFCFPFKEHKRSITCRHVISYRLAFKEILQGTSQRVHPCLKVARTRTSPISPSTYFSSRLCCWSDFESTTSQSLLKDFDLTGLETFKNVQSKEHPI